MNLIYYRGLNCHLACVVTIAAALGVNYRDAFGTLWSETDFIDDPNYHICFSQRVFPNLEALGIKLEVLNCASLKEAEESFARLEEGELFVVGMDTFHIPWGPVYQHFHGPHYFFAQKETPDALFCFDPTYNEKYAKLAPQEIVPHAFDLSRVCRLAAARPQFSLCREAREILRKHPDTQEELCAEIHKCKNRERETMTSLIKQITAMINNRYLFARFLHQDALEFSQESRFFDGAFFSQWEAVKNGLLKASIVRNNESVVDEVCRLFLHVMRSETEMAKEMIGMEPASG